MNSWQEGSVSANGIQLHYWRTGGDKPPLILCHGITDSGLCWTRAARALEGDYDLIMVDARGHGLSDKPAQGYTSEDHAADIAGLIETLSLDRPHIMGHSMGGATTSIVAFKWPELVNRVVLEDPPWREQTPEEAAASEQGLLEWRNRAAERKQLSVDEIIALGRQENPGWSDEEFAPWADAKQQVSLNVFNLRLRRTDWRQVSAGLTVPTLLVTGDPALGAIVTAEVAQMAEANPNIQVHNIAGAGHNIRREKFPEFIHAVTAFLAT